MDPGPEYAWTIKPKVLVGASNKTPCVWVLGKPTTPTLLPWLKSQIFHLNYSNEFK
jgi:hypothetical protein